MMLLGEGCSHLRLQHLLHSSTDDWMMYGGTAGRTNRRYDSLIPPLKIRWQYEVSGGFAGFGGSIADGVLCIADLRGEVSIIDIKTGKSLATKNFGSAIAGTPVIEGDLMIIAFAHDQKSIRAYNLISGAMMWSKQSGDIESSPLLLDARVYVTTSDGKLICLDKFKGETIWVFDPPVNRLHKMTRSSPASDGKIIVFGNDGGDLYAVDAINGQLKWKSSARGGIVASPSISDGKIFVGSLDSTFYAFDASTGEPVWMRHLSAKIYSSQAVDDRYLYMGTIDRTFYCLDKTDGSVLWNTQTGGVATSSPIVTGSVVYLGCLDKKLKAIDAKTGNIIWQYEADGRIKTSPVVWKNYLFLFPENRSVIAFQTENE